MAAKSKIYIGTIDIASQIRDFKYGFANLGYSALTTVLFNPSSLHINSYDYVLSEMKKPYFRGVRPRNLQRYLQDKFDPREKVFKKAINECDIFVFFWSSFRKDFSDLEELKRLGKKIVVFLVGTDVRYYHAYEQEMEKYGIPSFYDQEMRDDPNQKLENKISYLRHVEKYADLIYSGPNQCQLSLRPYFHFELPLILESIVENPIQREVPLIIHAPSKRAVKGTDIIIDTIEKLKAEGLKFDFKLIENLPNAQALAEYTNADILVAELYIPSGGKLDREALAAGTIVMSSIRKDYLDKVTDDNPVIPVNADNLYTELKAIIPDWERRKKLAVQGRPFVEKYNDVNAICADILKKLNLKEQDLTYDYYPDFYRNQYQPEIDKIQEHNNWIDFVRDCDWYKKYVMRGERNNLKF